MINNNLIKSTLTKTKIYFLNNKVADINKYVGSHFKQITSAVGCYNIEGRGKYLFRNVDGSYFNVIGIDIIKFLKILKSI